MCWMSPGDSDNQTKILHLKLDGGSWRPYTSFPQLAVADYDVPGGSKGWSTYQKLIKAGWEIIASPTEV